MSLLQMSVAGGVLIIVIMLARGLLISRLPKKTFLVLWCVALVRLLVPFSIQSEKSVYTFLQKSAAEETVREDVSSDPVSIGKMPVNDPEDTLGKAAGRLPVWKVVWLTGTLFWMFYFLVMYIRCRREFCMSLPVENAKAEKWQKEHPLQRKLEIRQTDRIQEPLTYGLLHPVILLPKSMDWEDDTALKFILEHEFVHIQRFDALLKLIMAGTLCLHWLNPLVWVMYVFFNRDLELSCDETVVHRFGEHTRSAYALVLIGREEKRSGFLPFCNSFGKNAVEERIGAIMKIRRFSVATGSLAVMLVAGISTVFATSAVSEKMQVFGNSDIETAAEQYAVIEDSLEDVSLQIEELEKKIEGDGEDKEKQAQEIEALKEQQAQLLIRQMELTGLEKLLRDYGEYGITVHIHLLDEDGSVLYLYDKPVRYLVDEENGGVLWTDEAHGDVAVQVMRDAEGNITELEEEKTEEPPSGQPGFSNEISEEVYQKYEKAAEDTSENSMSKMVQKNYGSGEAVPYALSYEEYVEGSWWGGILKKTDVSPIKGSKLYRATFEGMLYQR